MQVKRTARGGDHGFSRLSTSQRADHRCLDQNLRALTEVDQLDEQHYAPQFCEVLNQTYYMTPGGSFR